MDIGAPRRVIEVEPVTLPLAEVLPDPIPEPGPGTTPEPERSPEPSAP